MSLGLYTALIKRDQNNKIEDVALIRASFSLAAFFFSFFWFISHRMWRESLIFLIFEVALFKVFSFDIINFFEFVLLQLSFLLMIGVNAKNLNSKFLQRVKKYQKMGYFLAQNEEEARLKAMKSWHRNSPDLSFDEFSDDMIDPIFYLKSLRPKRKRAV